MPYLERLHYLSKNELTQLAREYKILDPEEKTPLKDVLVIRIQEASLKKKRLDKKLKTLPLFIGEDVCNQLNIPHYLRKKLTDDGILNVTAYVDGKIHGKVVQFAQYSFNDIETCRNHPDFQKRLAQYHKRSASAQKATATKTKTLIELVHNMSVEVKFIPLGQLRQKTLDAKYDWYTYQNDLRGNWENNPETVYYADEDTVQRWMRNYIRHNLTNYDETLYELVGKTGKSQAYLELQKVITDAICKVYPWYDE